MSIKVDHHVHLGEDKKYGYILKPTELINLMNQHKIDSSIIFSCPYQDFNRENPYFFSNRYVLNSAYSSNGRLIPFMFIHPFFDTRGEVELMTDSFFGFKLYCQAGDYSYNALGRSSIADYVFGQKKPVILHTSRTINSRPISLIDVVDSFPETPFHFAHCGRLFKQDLETLSSRHNVYIDISPLVTMCSDPRFFASEEERDPQIDIQNPNSVLKYLISVFGKDKILWGSDAPWSINMLSEGYKKETEVLSEIEGII